MTAANPDGRCAVLSRRMQMLHAGPAPAARFGTGPAAKTALLERICTEAAAAGLPVVFVGRGHGE